MQVKEGSSLYYSLLWIEPAARQRFINRLSMIQALATTLEDVQEPQVAQRKVHWWHEEIDRLITGQARHPALQACQPSMQGITDAIPACLDILAVASAMRFTAPHRNCDVDEQLSKSYTARLALLAHALSDSEADLSVDTHAKAIALALGKHEQLARLAPLVHRGLPVFSEEFYKQHSVTPADLAGRIRVVSEAPARPGNALDAVPVIVEKPGWQALIRSAVDEAHQIVQGAMQDSVVQERYRCPPLMPLWRLLVLREKQLRLWQRTQPDLLRERNTLTPLAKLFIAWRNRH